MDKLSVKSILIHCGGLNAGVCKVDIIITSEKVGVTYVLWIKMRKGQAEDHHILLHSPINIL